jgi:hypothetical protein
VIDRVLLAALALATTPIEAQQPIARREPSIAITNVAVVDVERGRCLA